ncbi:hypothetical protein E2C01_073537 [Portunus trituberculatus]|uniref:Uncharacterized protein n=1 Tax=Portunus trituberculatus TaxID=210409 RepID=A0A5B7IAU8_PORTR|nr:hypothetical protein [Portunus trituberculatus]
MILADIRDMNHSSVMRYATKCSAEGLDNTPLPPPSLRSPTFPFPPYSLPPPLASVMQLVTYCQETRRGRNGGQRGGG